MRIIFGLQHLKLVPDNLLAGEVRAHKGLIHIFKQLHNIEGLSDKLNIEHGSNNTSATLHRLRQGILCYVDTIKFIDKARSVIFANIMGRLLKKVLPKKLHKQQFILNW